MLFTMLSEVKVSWLDIGINLDKKSGGALTMASAEYEPITGVWGQSPQRGPGAEPLVRESGAKLP